jgi:microcystin-dependent protein
MSEPFIGHVMIFGGNFAPVGWAFCQGQLLEISQHNALSNLIGKTYGGDGSTNFALPDLRGRVPVHMGQGPGLSNYQIGEAAGMERVTLTTQQLPPHPHDARVRSGVAGNTNAPTSNSVLADAFQSGATPAYVYGTNNNLNQVSLATRSIQASGGNQSHENRQAYITLNFIIALVGALPSLN